MADLTPHFDVKISLENVEKDFENILQQIKPTWKKDSVTYEVIGKGETAGALNGLVKCVYEPTKEGIIIRVTNDEADFIVNRKAEVIWCKHFMALGCGPKVLATYKNGFCMEFVEGELVFSERQGQEPYWRHIAETMARFNASKIADSEVIDKNPKTSVFYKAFLEKYPTHYEDPKKNAKFQAELPSKKVLDGELKMIMERCEQLGSPLVISHGDTRGENIFWNDKTGKITFIDFEIAGYNHQASEIAWHFMKYCGYNPPNYSLYPSKEFQLKWMRLYLQKYNEYLGNKMEVTDKDVCRLYVQVSNHYLLYLLIEGVMGVTFDYLGIIESDIIDCLEYAAVSVKEYFKLKDEILAMKMP